MPFTHLHLHTEYSLLDGANRIAPLVQRLQELGMDACAITDHGVMYGIVDFYSACLEAGIKPILGCEVYVAPGSRLDKESAGSRRNAHLILLAENQTGLRNLYKLVSQAFIDGFYYKPRVDKELLRQHHEGLIALSACLNGAVNQRLAAEDYPGAVEEARTYLQIFGDGNYFLEVQANGLLEQRRANEALRRISEETGIPLVATNDCHYLKQADAGAHEVLLCIQTGKRLSDESRMRMGTDQLYVKSEAEMRRDLPDFQDAIERTAEIAARCSVELTFGQLHLPSYDAPNGMASDVYLRRLCEVGLERRLRRESVVDLDKAVLAGTVGGVDSVRSVVDAAAIDAANGRSPERRSDYVKRLEHELDVIIRMGYTDYYLVVWDFIRYAREHEIMVGPGRGSGAGSLAAYCLGITNIDPLRYNLLFERFLNPERVSMPDFDTDFCYERRQEVINYVTEKYGSERVAQVIAFGTLAARACVRDVARVMDLPYAESDRLAKWIPAELGMTLSKALEQSPELKAAYEGDPAIKRILDTSLLLEGMPRHASTHAAGVVISSQDLSDLVPLSRNEDAIVIQFAKENIEKLGLLKFDFLGLRTLTVLRDTRDMVAANGGPRLDFDTLPMDDPKVYEMISKGDTIGVFQLESSGMTAFMKELHPESLEDIIAGISLFRPGPMVAIPRYVAARHDASKIHYEHPLLKPILQVTYGCIVYQEQVMQIVRALAGFSLGQADNIRRAMSKKKPELLARYRELFVKGGGEGTGQAVDGAVKRGVTEDLANKIFDELQAFAGYAFNKSHAAAYAVLAYQTAWLKYYYPGEFMAAMLNSFLGDLGQAAVYTQAAQDMGITILPPDIQNSDVRFRTEGKKAIRFALAAVKNTGTSALQALLEERDQGGPFRSFGDFLRRAVDAKINKKVVESLIFASALDCFNVPRNQMLAVFESYMDQVQKRKRSVMEGQISFFDMMKISGDDHKEKEKDVASESEPIYPPLPKQKRADLLAMEQSVLGLYISGHPLDDYRSFWKRLVAEDIPLFPSHRFRVEAGDAADSRLSQERYNDVVNRRNVVMLGLCLSIEQRNSRRGNRFAVAQMEDFDGRYEMMIFEQALRAMSFDIKAGDVLLCRGQIMARDDEIGKLALERAYVCGAEGLDELREDLRHGEQRGYGGGERNTGYGDNGGRQPFAKRRQPDVSTAASISGTGSERASLPQRKRKAIQVQIAYSGKVNDEGYRMLCATLAYFHGDTPAALLFPGEQKARPLPRPCWVNLDRDLLRILTERYGTDAIRFLPLES